MHKYYIGDKFRMGTIKLVDVEVTDTWDGFVRDDGLEVEYAYQVIVSLPTENGLEKIVTTYLEWELDLMDYISDRIKLGTEFEQIDEKGNISSIIVTGYERSISYIDNIFECNEEQFTQDIRIYYAEIEDINGIRNVAYDHEYLSSLKRIRY